MTVLAFTCVRMYGFQSISTSVTLLNAISLHEKVGETVAVFLTSTFSLMTISFPLPCGLGDVSHNAPEQPLCSATLPEHRVEHVSSPTSQMVAFPWFLEFWYIHKERWRDLSYFWIVN